MSANVRRCRQDDENDEDTDCGPRSTHCIGHGQPLVSECADDQCDETDSIENEQQLPGGRREVRMIHRNRCADQGRESEVDRQSDSPIADHPNPSCQVRHQSLVLLGNLKRPV